MIFGIHMAEKYSVNWSYEANNQVKAIIDFLKLNWNEKAAEDFLDLLFHFEKTISSFPKSFKVSNKYKGCRLGLVHQHVTAVYKIHKRQITILTVIDNRSNTTK